MKRFAKLLVVTLGFGALGFVISLVPQRNATGAGAAPVSIVSSIPLSVNGTLSAQQSGNWNVGITGTPTVSLAAGTGVNVRNPLDSLNNPIALVTRDTDQAARRPFSAGVGCNLGLNGGLPPCPPLPTGNTTRTLFQPPIGQTAAVQFVAAECNFTASGQSGAVEISFLSAGAPEPLRILYGMSPFSGTSGNNFVVVTQPTTIYVQSTATEQGSIFLDTLEAQPGALVGDCHIDVTGYLIQN
jgi:hypothetical protein